MGIITERMELPLPRIQKRNDWFKYVFFPLCAGNEVIEYATIAWQKDTLVSQSSQVPFITAAQKVREVLVAQSCDDVNNELRALASVIGVKGTNSTFSNTARDVACYIASLFQEKNIYFDDAVDPKYSKAKINRFKQHTILGVAFKDFGCFLSDKLEADKKQATVNTGGAKASTTTPAAQTAPATSAQSTTTASPRPSIKNCYGLVTKTKVSLANSVYWIGGTFINAGKTSPRVHVKPLRKPKSGNDLDIFTNGSGQGYEDMVLFWDSEAAAKNAAQVVDTQKHGDKVKNYQVKRQTAKGDYYEVATTLGKAYIQADRLVEMCEQYQTNWANNINELIKSLD